MKLKPEVAQAILRQLKTINSLKDCDNKKLLWLAMQTEFFKDAPTLGTEAAIIDELIYRLYPEWDGESVTIEEWGWKTPNGEIRYIPK